MRFLEHASPLKTKSFVFAGAENKPEIDFYLDGLSKALPAASTEVYIWDFNFSNLAFDRIVKASANSKRIIVRSSSIDCSCNFDFGGYNYNTEYFGLLDCGDKVGDNWSSYPSKLEQIIYAISDSSMKKSLKTLNVYNCGVKAKTIEKLLKQYKFKSVTVIEEYIDPYSD